MQIKTLLTLLLAACLVTPAVALKKGKKAKKVVPAATLTPAQTLPSFDGETFSAALGIAQASSLKQYLQLREQVEDAYLEEAMRGMTAQISDDERKKDLAFAAGLRIAEINQRNLPLFNKEASGSKDSAYVNLQTFQKVLADAVLGKETAISADSAMKIVEGQIKFQQEKYKAANLDFLAQNAKLKGIKVLPSGLQYQVLTEGHGPVATDSTEVEVHYEGSLIDGTVFDSSYSRKQPATFRPNQVIKGWREALTMMPEGSVWKLYIPYELGYGERGSGEKIPGFSTLIFTVENLKVKGEAKPETH